MWKLNSLSETDIKLLESGIIHIGGEVRSEMASYVWESVLRLRYLPLSEIEVAITCWGGEVGLGLDIYDYLRLSKVKKKGVVIGYAKSMAVTILQACEIRQCAKHAQILVHKIRTENLKLGIDELKDSDTMNRITLEMETKQQSIYSIFQERSGKSREEIEKIFKEARLLSPSEALEYGFIDEII